MRSGARTWYAVAMFAIGITALLYFKPRFMFREDGTMIPFGVGEGKTVFSFGVAVIVLSILSSFVFAMADMIPCKRTPEYRWHREYPAPAVNRPPPSSYASDPFAPHPL